MIFKRTIVQDKAYSSFPTRLQHITRTKQEQEEETLFLILTHDTVDTGFFTFHVHVHLFFYSPNHIQIQQYIIISLYCYHLISQH